GPVLWGGGELQLLAGRGIVGPQKEMGRRKSAALDQTREGPRDLHRRDENWPLPDRHRDRLGGIPPCVPLLPRPLLRRHETALLIRKVDPRRFSETEPFGDFRDSVDPDPPPHPLDSAPPHLFD